MCSMTSMAQGNSDNERAEKLTTAYQQMAFSLFNEVIKNEDENVCFSPLSAQIALSMLQNGAGEPTLSLMQQAMGTAGYTLDEVNAFNQSLTKKLTKRPEFNYIENPYVSEEEMRASFDTYHPLCEIANALWNRPDVEICKPFSDCLQTYYDAGTGPVEFSTQQGIDYINGWVKEKTHGLIEEIYHEPQPDDLAIVLINSLYLKAAWLTPFLKELTQKGAFHSSAGKELQADMMYVSGTDFTVAEAGQFRSVTIPYYNDFSMTVFMPAEGYRLPSFSYEDWKEAMDVYASMRYDDQVGVNLKLPKFDVEGKYDLIPPLCAMGMAGIFQSGSDFTKMCLANKMVSGIFQMDKIKVDEEGTEAAAVTVVEESDGIPPTPAKIVDFFVDRPFYFTIESTKSKSILFIGRILDPGTEKSGSTTGIETTSDSQKNAPVYDLSGRLLSRIPDTGIFIQNGKKFIRR